MAGVASDSVARPQRNAFINRRVQTVAELVDHVATDMDVRSRYTRHFAMSASELTGFLSGLRVKRLTHSRVYTVYAVPQGGEITGKARKLVAGTPVFVDRTGTPVLMWVCGNPLMRGPKRPFSTDVVVRHSLIQPDEEVAEVPVDPSISEESELVLGAEEPEFVAIAEPTAPTVTVPQATPETVTQTTGESSIPIVSWGNSGWLGLLPAVAVIVPLTNTGSDVNPVPEPGTMIALGAGAAALIARRKKRA